MCGLNGVVVLPVEVVVGGYGGVGPVMTFENKNNIPDKKKKKTIPKQKTKNFYKNVENK